MPTGFKIKDIRIKKGLTQKQLGEKCGMYESQIRKYENGKANPKMETLRKIAVALECNVSDLLDDTESAGYYIAQHPSKDAIASSVFQTILDFYGDDFTEEEIEDIRRYIEFVKSKRKDFILSGPMKKVTTQEASEHLGTDVSKLLKNE